MNYRSPFFAFVLGIAFGGALGAASVVHTVTIQAEKRLASLTEMWDRQLKDADHLTDQCREKLEKEQAQTAECLRAGQAMQQGLHDRDAHDRFFTMVYEPGASGPSPDAMFGMLDAIRPGLGTLLSKVHQSQAPQGLTLRMVLDGYVKAEALPTSVHLVYTLNPQTQAVQ